MRGIAAPISANQTVSPHQRRVCLGDQRGHSLTTNPCNKVDRNVTKQRERVLSAPLRFQSFGKPSMMLATSESMALKMILLTGQRPGEVSPYADRAHRWRLVGNAGAAVPSLDWPGTKNGAKS